MTAYNQASLLTVIASIRQMTYDLAKSLPDDMSVDEAKELVRVLGELRIAIEPMVGRLQEQEQLRHLEQLWERGS